jgi:indole-3-pyruvate monooxygenase
MVNVNHTNTIIAAAGAAGLACAGSLTRCGIPFIILEESSVIGLTWLFRYDRLHLHTTRNTSQLPYFNMPQSYPKYVPKDLYAAYLKDCASSINLCPLFGQKVSSVQQRANAWGTRTDKETYSSKHVTHVNAEV